MKVRTLPPLRGPPSSLLSVSATALRFLSVSTLRAEKALPFARTAMLHGKPAFSANYKPGTTNYPSPFPAKKKAAHHFGTRLVHYFF